MLLGEYAVLHGHVALVCAIDKRMSVALAPRVDNVLRIVSDRYGIYETTVTQLAPVAPFEFVLETVRQVIEHVPSGCDIMIDSSFSDQVGFGSSAALVAALLTALNQWLQLDLSPIELVRYGREVVQRVQQGLGSGADIAASIYGGIVAYQMAPLSVQSLPYTYPLVAYYAGFKTKTAIAIQQVSHAFKQYPALFDGLMRAIGECALAGIDCVKQNDFRALGKLFSIQQGLMEALGVSMPVLQQLVAELQHQPSMLGAKISGAGLGDCVIGLGNLEAGSIRHIMGTNDIPVEMSIKGACCERI